MIEERALRLENRHTAEEAIRLRGSLPPGGGGPPPHIHAQESIVQHGYGLGVR